MASPGGTSSDVVIVGAGRDDVLSACLDSLSDSPVGRITVVDNGPDPCPVLPARFADVDLVRGEQQLGYAAACNMGAGRGEGELILFLNDDIVAEPGSVAALSSALASSSAAVAAGGRLVDSDDGSTQLAYRPKRFPTLTSLALQLTGIARLWPTNPVTRRHSGAELDDLSTVAVDQPAGACLLVRREAFERVGGFDPGYWYWYEDVDLMRRLHGQGAALYVPSAPFRHIGGLAFESWDQAMVVGSRFHGLLRYAAANFSAASRIGLAAVVALVSLPRAALYSLTEPRLGRAWRSVARSSLALAAGRAPGPG